MDVDPPTAPCQTLPLKNSFLLLECPISVSSALNPFFSPEPHPRPSLKRSRSSPILSPPLSSNPNPFSQSLDLCDPPVLHTSDPSQSKNPFATLQSSLKTTSPFVLSDPSDLSEDLLLLSQWALSSFFWNVRGLNDPTKHRPFVSWLNSNKLTFKAILETHIKQPFLSPIISSICPNWKFTSNHSADPDERIILIWRDTINIQVISQSRQCITCMISFPNHQPVYYSAVYASNLSSERVDLWTDLIQLQSTLDLDNNSWVLGGDLNQIIHPMEHSDLRVVVPDYLMYQLRDCLTQLGLFDLHYIGSTLTWINSQPLDPISKKLDKLLTNNNFVASFPHILASFLPPNFSDHSPCVLDLSFNFPSAGTQPYKFQNYLTKHPGFSQLIQGVWIQAGTACQTLVQLCWKLKQIKSDPKQPNKDNYSKIQERVSETNILLQHAQVQALQNPDHSTFQAERDLHQKWSFLCEIEEMFFR